MSREHPRRNLRRLVLLALAGSVAAPALAAPLTIVKAATTLSDPQGDLFPKAVPGAVVDYTITVTNPGANLLTTVNGVVFQDVVPPKTALRVSDLNLGGSGPIEFLDGSLLGTGLTGSNLSYAYAGLASDADGLEFSADNGSTWTFHPSDQGGGYDPRVTNVRVRLTGDQAAGSTFRLRFRIKLL